MACINKNYNISRNWNGRAHCGLTLDWDYKKRTVDLSMPGYIKAALHKYQQLVSDKKTSPAHSDKDVNK
jgi:hypothetical protein